ncbi:phiSA1p31-related protein [Streptomyces fractus]|uniref:phiSA1p31-related protein n=1 Tax=Streptomyces fractus TaxID=641806 RepID=UPI003CF0A9E5
MATTFKVGDKVKHRTFGAGEVAFGPFEHFSGSDMYLMKEADSDRHVFSEPAALTLASAYEVGDKVRVYADGGYTVKAGPFAGHATEWYVVGEADGVDYRANVGTLTREPEAAAKFKVGDKVRVLVDYADGASVSKGDVFTVQNVYSDEIVTDGNGLTSRWFFKPANVELVDDANTYTHDGVTYDLSARYRDKEGDFWTFRRIDGEARGNYRATDVDCSALINKYSDTLETVVSDYGPLTRVNA